MLTDARTIKLPIIIPYRSSTYSEKFAILHVWRTAEAYILSCIIYNKSMIDCSGGRDLVARAEIEVEVEEGTQGLPFKVYLVTEKPGLTTLNHMSVMGVTREADIPENERQDCLYTNPDATDANIRIEDTTNDAHWFGVNSLGAYAKSSAKVDLLIDKYNGPAEIQRILASDDHDDDEKIIVQGLASQCGHISRQEKSGVLNKEEADAVLAKLDLRREDVERIAVLQEKYRYLSDDLHAKIDAYLTAAAKPASNTSILSTDNLKRFGVFAGGVALAVGTACVASNMLR